MSFIAHDDEGVIHLGTKRECLDAIVECTHGLTMVYTSNELRQIRAYFRAVRVHDEDYISYFGFTVEKAENYEN